MGAEPWWGVGRQNGEGCSVVAVISRGVSILQGHCMTKDPQGMSWALRGLFEAPWPVCPAMSPNLTPAPLLLLARIKNG